MKLGKTIRVAGIALLGLAIAATGAWGTLAIAFCRPPGIAGVLLSEAFALAAVLALVSLAFTRWRMSVASTYAVLFCITLAWWEALEPSNDRDWQPDVAVLPFATFDGPHVDVHNIRNFAYRSEADYTPAYYDKRFDLDKLRAVDLVAVYWMGPAIAHTIVSFEFEGGEHLAISVETRKKKRDTYSTLRGFFRQYELIYVVADERDVVRLRTNYRRDPPEDVYIYRLSGAAENGRRFFIDYMRKVNALKDSPQFYNTLTSNCTTEIWSRAMGNEGHVPLSWKVLVSGYVPEYLYEIGRLDTSVPFAELTRRAHVNARAQAADAAEDFSRRIRQP